MNGDEYHQKLKRDEEERQKAEKKRRDDWDNDLCNPLNPNSPISMMNINNPASPLHQIFFP